MNSRKLLAFFIVSLLSFAWFCCSSLAQPIMVEKNLFSSDRKPTTDEAPEAEKTHRGSGPTGLPPKSVQLDGIFIRQDVKKALLRVSGQLLGETARGKGKGPKDQFPYMTVSEGETIGDFKVVKIEPRSVSLERDQQVYVISLFMDGKMVPPAAQLPAAPIAPQPEKSSPAAPAGGTPAMSPAQQAQVPLQPGMPPAPGSPAGASSPAGPPNVNDLPVPPVPPADEPGMLSSQQ